MIPLDNRGGERRQATPVDTTANLPEGTVLTVPVAPKRGPTCAPVVAVDARSKWTDPLFLLTFVTSMGSTVASIVDLIPAEGDINWRVTAPKIAFAVINGIAAFLRTQINTVTK